MPLKPPRGGIAPEPMLSFRLSEWLYRFFVFVVIMAVVAIFMFA